MKFFVIFLLLLTNITLAQDEHIYLQDKRFDIVSTEQANYYLKNFFHQDVSSLGDLKKQKDDAIKLDVLSQKEASDLFILLANKKNIPYAYSEDGCYARAQRMVFIAQRKGISLGKIYVAGSLDPFLDDDWKWRYHVAPILAVKEHDKIVLKVIDPSLFNEVVSVEDWVTKSIGHGNFSDFRILLRNRYTYYYRGLKKSPKFYSPFRTLDTISTFYKYRRELKRGR